MIMSRIRALIVDDRPRSRQGLRALLVTWSEIEVVGEASNGAEALQLVERLRPDVVLMDARMPVMDGLEATRRIRCRWPQINVIVLTMYPDYRQRALAAGACTFLVKGGSSADLLAAIRSRTAKS
jgi:DNA-binding NarL/FixJ family response regulator